MMAVFNLSVAVPAAVYLAWNGGNIAREAGILIFLAVSLVGFIFNTWMVYRIHLERARYKAQTYGELVRQTFGITDGNELVLAKAMMTALPLIQWIIHLSIPQLNKLGVWPMVGIRAALSILLITLTLIPYGLLIVPYLAIIGWLCLGTAGGLAWTPSQLTLLPEKLSAGLFGALAMHLLGLMSMGSFLTAVEYQIADGPAVLLVSACLQIVVISYPLLFAHVTFPPLSHYLTIPISLASLLLFSHYLYQRRVGPITDQDEARPSVKFRYAVPLSLLLVTNGLALLPKVYTPFGVTLNMLNLSLLTIDLFMGVGILLSILWEAGERIKVIMTMTVVALLCLTRFISNFIR